MRRLVRAGLALGPDNLIRSATVDRRFVHVLDPLALLSQRFNVFKQVGATVQLS